jgi:hypothetical protein
MVDIDDNPRIKNDSVDKKEAKLVTDDCIRWI